MSIKENLKSIVNELDTNTLSIDYEEFNNLTDQITHMQKESSYVVKEDLV